MCVVRRPTTDGELEYLLVQRPDEGLLAGQWEFPSVLHPPLTSITVSPDLQRQRLIDTHLASLLPRYSSSFPPTSRLSVGEYTHVFSHRRHLMHVELMTLPEAALDEDGEEQRPKRQWVRSSGIEAVGLTSGQRAVFQLARGGQRSVARKPDRRPKGGQAKIKGKAAELSEEEAGEEAKEKDEGEEDDEDDRRDEDEEWEAWPAALSTREGPSHVCVSRDDAIVID